MELNIKSEQRRCWLLFWDIPKKFNEILDKRTPYQNLSIQEVKLSKKTWITTEILNSVKNKNRIHRKVIRAKDSVRKTENRLYKSQLDKILKESKSMYCQKLFEANKLNLRKTWDGIREVINIKKNKRLYRKCSKQW